MATVTEAYPPIHVGCTAATSVITVVIQFEFAHVQQLPRTNARSLSVTDVVVTMVALKNDV